MIKNLRQASKHQKNWYGRWHTWAGITAGFILVIVGLTGALLTFEAELDMWIYPELFEFDESKPRLSFQEVVDKIKPQHPDWDMHGIFIMENHHDAYVIRLHEGDEHKQVIIDPGTGEITGIRVYGHSVMGFIRNLHRSLLIPKAGRYLVGISSLVCVILMITGLRLWIPKKTKNLVSRLTVKWTASKKRVNFDLHNSLGFYFSPVISLISITGVVMTFSQFIFLFLFLLSFRSPQSISSIFNQKSIYQAGIPALSIDSLQAIAESNIEGAKLHGLSFPHDSVGTYSMNLVSPSINHNGNRSILWLDQYSGKVVYTSEAKDIKLGKLYLNWVSPIHFGTFGGLTTRIIALISSLVMVTLFITGFIIWLPRMKKRARQKPISRTAHITQSANVSPQQELVES